jgi:hypothetical protein
MKEHNMKSKKSRRHVLKSPPTFSLSQSNHTGLQLITAKYKKGDLVILSKFGLMLRSTNNNARIGIVMTNPRNYYMSSREQELIYWVYDVVVGSELIIDVPQEFLIRIEKNENEENIK